MDRRLIINADDFGWDSDATQAILNLADNHKITSTTIIANMVRVRDLYSLNRLSHVSTGIHVNLISGYPSSSSDKVASLIDKSGQFYRADQLLTRFLLGKVKQSELEIEIVNQIEFLRRHHLKISHADSHKHIHQYPILGAVIIRILKKQGIIKIRNCNVLNCNDKKMIVVKGFNSFSRLFSSYYSSPDLLITAFSNHKEASLSIFGKAIEDAFFKKSTIEFMTHPALKNREGSYLNRLAEYQFWLNENWEDFLNANKIKLINYNEL
jgi:predicted glycoside hydrolase/deacetylase ChbG (UPF0249 family)